MAVALADLLADYKASLHDAVAIFVTDPVSDDHFVRHLRMAMRAVAIQKRPRTSAAELTLVAGQGSYAAPDDMLLPKISQWGHTGVPAWRQPRGQRPRMQLIDSDPRELLLTPPPNCEQIAAWGSSYVYYYAAAHTLDENAGTTTLADADINLVILRAQVEAMREAAMRDVAKPVHLRGGSPSGSVPKAGMPAALYQQLLAEYRDAV